MFGDPRGDGAVALVGGRIQDPGEVGRLELRTDRVEGCDDRRPETIDRGPADQRHDVLRAVHAEIVLQNDERRLPLECEGGVGAEDDPKGRVAPQDRLDHLVRIQREERGAGIHAVDPAQPGSAEGVHDAVGGSGEPYVAHAAGVAPVTGSVRIPVLGAGAGVVRCVPATTGRHRQGERDDHRQPPDEDAAVRSM